jgi:biopolymer transport protein ExbD
MRQSFGPWTTGIDAGSFCRLNTLWKTRMAMLLPTSRQKSATSCRAVVWLFVAGLFAVSLPTFRPATASALENGRESPAGGGNDRATASTEQPPNARAADEENPREFVVEVAFRRDKNGDITDTVPFIFYGDTAIRPSAITGAMTDLRQRFERSGRIPKKVTIVVHADVQVNAKIVQNLIKSLQTVGFEKFALKALRGVENERGASWSRRKNNNRTLEIKIRLKAEVDGSLANLTVGRRSLGNDKDVADLLNVELHKMFEYLDIHPGKNVEVQIEVDRNLNYKILTKIITACSVYLNRKTGKTARYVQRIKFASQATAKELDK